MRLSYVVPAVVLASQASAFNFLHARQFEDIAGLIPPQCESACGPTLTTLQGCVTESASDPACACTPAVEAGLDECFDCFIEIVRESGSEAAVDAIEEQGDALKDQLKTMCDAVTSPTGDDDLPSSTRSSTASGRPSASASDDDSTSTTVSRPATTTRDQTTVRPPASSGASNGDPTTDDNNTDPLLDGGAAAPIGLSLGGLAAAAAGALFLL